MGAKFLPKFFFGERFAENFEGARTQKHNFSLMVGSLFSLHHIINGCPTEQIDLPTNNKWLLNSGNTFNFYIIFFSQKKKLLYHILHLQTFSFKEHPANSTLNLDSNLMESLFSLHHLYYYLRVSFSFFLVQKFSYTPIFKGSFGYNWKLKTEKYCIKIIFKCVNNIMGPIFNEKIAEKWGLWVPWLKSYWKSYCVCTIHTPKSTIMA